MTFPIAQTVEHGATLYKNKNIYRKYTGKFLPAQLSINFMDISINFKTQRNAVQNSKYR